MSASDNMSETIIVNGQEHQIDDRKYLMYAQIVLLAGMSGSPSMTWRIRGTNEGGIVEPTGEKAVVPLRAGLVFNVAHTGERMSAPVALSTATRCPWSHRIGYDCELTDGHEGTHTATDLDGKSKVGWEPGRFGEYNRRSLHRFDVGDRVEDGHWGAGTVSSLRSPGVVAVKFDCAGTLHITESCLTPIAVHRVSTGEESK